MKWKKIITILSVILLLSTLASGQTTQILERSCQGNYVVGKILDSESRISYRILDFCPYGCIYGYCLSKREVPSIDIKSIYEVRACEDNVIFIEINNEGTRGEIYLEVEGEASNFIKIPNKVSIYSNETKTIAIIASIPCNISEGAYPFILIGKGAINFYAPSVLKVLSKEKMLQLPITTTISPIGVKTAIIILVILILTYLVYIKSLDKKKEEKP